MHIICSLYWIDRAHETCRCAVLCQQRLTWVMQVLALQSKLGRRSKLELHGLFLHYLHDTAAHTASAVLSHVCSANLPEPLFNAGFLHGPRALSVWQMFLCDCKSWPHAHRPLFVTLVSKLLVAGWFCSVHEMSPTASIYLKGLFLEASNTVWAMIALAQWAS